MKKKYINNGNGEANFLQNRFTSYVEKALSNNRITYVKKIANYSVVELCEDITTHAEYTETEWDGDPLDLVYGTEFDMLDNIPLYTALHELDDKDLSIIKLHVIYEYTYQQIAVIMGMTMSAVRARYSRAIQRIKRTLERYK